jgi:hypothetical protein
LCGSRRFLRQLPEAYNERVLAITRDTPASVAPK